RHRQDRGQVERGRQEGARRADRDRPHQAAHAGARGGDARGACADQFEELVSSPMSSFTLDNLALATALWLGFVGGLFFLRKVVPGPARQGQLLHDGTRKRYKLNALAILLLFVVFLAVGQGTHLFTLSTVYRLFWPLFAVGNVLAIAQSLWLLVR